MMLTKFCLHYISQRDLSKQYAETIYKRCRALQTFTGRSSVADNLTSKNVNEFLQQLPKLSPYTVAKYRADLLAIWRAAADADLCAYPVARRVWKPKKHSLVIECLTHAEVTAIVEAAEKLKGCLPDGRARRHYWSAIIRAGWDTGLRRGDLWRLTADTAAPDGTFKLSQSKTRKIVRCTLRPSTVEKIRLAGGSLEWNCCFRSFTLGWHRLVTLSDIGRKAQFKWLRRGVGSLVESLQPGAGAKSLGNTDAVFRQHYDAQLRPVDLPRTPELETV